MKAKVYPSQLSGVLIKLWVLWLLQGIPNSQIPVRITPEPFELNKKGNREDNVS